MIPAPSPVLGALRLWDDRYPSRDGVWNMAVDEALLTTSQAGGIPILRIYRWAKPTLSFGYFLTFDEARAALHPDEDLIRRWTGGGMVHHGEGFTWTLAVPRQDPFSATRPALSYTLLHGNLATALTQAGLEGVTLVPAENRSPTGGLCAASPAPGDLLWKGRKIAGAGQRRTRQGLLHQGVILLPETRLGGDFARQLSISLARQVLLYTPPANWSVPVQRYADPAWNTKR